MPGVSSVRFWSKLTRRADIAAPVSFAVRPIQHLPGLMIEVTEAVGLNAVGNDGEQQVPRQMSGRRTLKYALPSRPKSLRSRPRRCAISSSTEVLVAARPLRRFSPSHHAACFTLLAGEYLCLP